MQVTFSWVSTRGTGRRGGSRCGTTSCCTPSKRDRCELASVRVVSLTTFISFALLAGCEGDDESASPRIHRQDGVERGRHQRVSQRLQAVALAAEEDLLLPGRQQRDCEKVRLLHHKFSCWCTALHHACTCFARCRWVNVLEFVVQAELPSSHTPLREKQNSVEGSSSNASSVRQASFVPPPTPTTPNSASAMIYETIADVEEVPADDSIETDAWS